MAIFVRYTKEKYSINYKIEELELMNSLNLLLDGAASPLGGNSGMIIMMVALFAIMYFFMIRPQQKKQKQLQEARNAIKVGDRVVTAGGIHGKVKEVKDSTFTVEIAEDIKITIEKTSVFVSVGDSQAQTK